CLFDLGGEPVVERLREVVRHQRRHRAALELGTGIGAARWKHTDQVFEERIGSRHVDTAGKETGGSEPGEVAPRGVGTLVHTPFEADEGCGKATTWARSMRKRTTPCL